MRDKIKWDYLYNLKGLKNYYKFYSPKYVVSGVNLEVRQLRKYSSIINNIGQI